MVIPIWFLERQQRSNGNAKLAPAMAHGPRGANSYNRPSPMTRPRPDSPGVDVLAPAVYDELRRLAGAFMRRERPGQTLQPTALVHEAYLRLAGAGTPW